MAQHSDRLILDRYDAFIFETVFTSCHIWTGACDPKGYALFNTRRGRRPMKASRFTWELAHGTAIPAGLVVRHTCDHPYCVNPDHLILGTQAENMADMRARGRHKIRYPHKPMGHLNPASRLTEDDVRSIRMRHEAGEATYAALAREYGVSHSCVWNIVWRKRWKHVA